MLPLGYIINKLLQLLISLSTDNFQSINSLVSWVEEINDWMTANFLQLNRGKTEILVVGTKAQRQLVCEYLESRSLKTSDQIKNLGVTMDSELSFKDHISGITKVSFFPTQKHFENKRLSFTE